MVKVMAVASAGGHWIQLRRLRPAFDGLHVTWVTTHAALAQEAGPDFAVVRDANRWQRWAMVVMFLQVVWLVLRRRPDVIVTTGAAPGLAAIVAGRVLGCRTVWIDSIANSEELSGSGRVAGRWADLWLTQWPDLATDGGPAFWGAVL